MSASKRIFLAVSFSWLSRAVSILSNLFLIPILFRFMGKEELGVWFLLGNSQGFLGLLGMGVAPVLTRDIALAKGRSGAAPEVELTEESKRHIGDIFVTGKIILQWLAIAVFFVAWLSGYGVIGQLELKEVNPQIVFWSWTLMCAGYAVGVWVSNLNCLLTGMGYVGWDSLIETALIFLTIVTNIVAVLLGGGLLHLAAISVVFSLVKRLIILKFIRWRKPELLEVKGKWNSQYAKTMVKPCFDYWFTSLGGFLILRTDAYFIAFLRSSQEIPIYNASYQLISNLYQLSTIFGSASSVFISQAWQAGDLNITHKLTFRNARLGLLVMATGVAFFLSAGQELMNLWLGEGNFIGYPVLLVFCIMLTLDSHHVNLLFSSRAAGDNSYAVSTLISGFLNIIFSWILIKPLGLLGVAMGTLLAQMLTNDWYCVYRAMVYLKINFYKYFQQVIFVGLMVFLISLIFAKLTKQLLIILNINNISVTVGLIAVICGIAFIATGWLWILEEQQQKFFKKKISQIIQK